MVKLRPGFLPRLFFTKNKIQWKQLQVCRESAIKLLTSMLLLQQVI